MIIVKVMGGLGNQFFQYALYRQLQELGKEVYLDTSWYQGGKNVNRKYQLDLFQTRVQKCSQGQRDQLANNDKNIIGMLYHKLFGKKKSHIIESETGEFDPAIFQLQIGYLDGYWQREAYFKNISELLRRELQLKNGLNDMNNKVLQEINKVNSVAIHVRRGDYLKAQSMYGGICTEKYYINSMEYMEKHISAVQFFVFSDDLNWCRNFFKGKSNVTVVDVNDEDTGCCDFALMSKCKNIIMANSSFSWWAAWLNLNTEKIVVAPSRWQNGADAKNIMPGEWTRL